MIRYASLTNIGGMQINEDSIGIAEKGNEMCFVLCDGLGGHGMGDVASGLVKECILWKFEDLGAGEHFISKAMEESQFRLLSEQKKLSVKSKMKTTAVVLAMDEKKAFIGHIGDSRLYAFRKGKVKFRTIDHSIPQMLVISGEIKESEIRNHPERNMLLRVLGTPWDEPEYEIRKKFSWKKYQAFLLCSDGFWELIEENLMCELLNSSASVEEWLQKMGEVVAINGKGKKMDNYSAIAIWNEE